MKCGLVVGHSKERQGAKNNRYDVSEYEYNSTLVKNIMLQYPFLDIECNVTNFSRTKNIYELVKDINATDVSFVLEFHANAFDTTATGCEFLYYHKSDKSKKIAKILNDNFISRQFKSRGIKPISENDRGGYFLSKTKMPAVICETFFIDNDDDLTNAVYRSNDIVFAYLKSIIDITNFMKS